VSTLEQKSNSFEGKVFCVISGSDTISKQVRNVFSNLGGDMVRIGHISC